MSIAGLPASNACVRVKPPFMASGPIFGSRLLLSPVEPSPHEAPLSMLLPSDVNDRSPAATLQFDGVLPDKMVFRSVAGLPECVSPPPEPAVVARLPAIVELASNALPALLIPPPVRDVLPEMVLVRSSRLAAATLSTPPPRPGKPVALFAAINERSIVRYPPAPNTPPPLAPAVFDEISANRAYTLPAFHTPPPSRVAVLFLITFPELNASSVAPARTHTPPPSCAVLSLIRTCSKATVPATTKMAPPHRLAPGFPPMSVMFFKVSLVDVVLTNNRLFGAARNVTLLAPSMVTFPGKLKSNGRLIVTGAGPQSNTTR